jgi:hypothetical protein
LPSHHHEPSGECTKQVWLEDSWAIMAAGIVADGEVLSNYEYTDVWVDSIGARRRPSDSEQSASAEVSDFCRDLKYQSG